MPNVGQQATRGGCGRLTTVVCSWHFDTTLVSAVQGDGEPTRGAADRDGVALGRVADARSKRVQPGARARSVVIGFEVGGRWSKEAMVFVQLLARARARSEPPVIQRRMEQAWRLRWLSIISCAAARAFEASCWSCEVGADGQATVPRGGT